MNSFVYFKILEGLDLPFKYSLVEKDIYKADNTQEGIEAADTDKIIEVINWEVHDKQYNGGPEPIYEDNCLMFVQPDQDGRKLEISRFYEYECKRCGHINYTPPHNGKLSEPFECQNDACGRKGPFDAKFPMELTKPIWKIGYKPIDAPAYEVYKDIYEYIKDHLVLKDDEYHIMTLWIMASWLVDDFDTAPYLIFIAPKSSGKTQCLNVILELGYRAFLTVSVTGPAIFRSIDAQHITPLIDESEFQVNTEKMSESSAALYAVLNGGYKRGNKALRIEGEARIPTAFDIFGFKAVASTKLFLSTLESRGIIINVAQGMPKNILIDMERPKRIRSKLINFRFSNLKKLKTVIPESKSGRLTELFIPLFTTAQTMIKTNGIASIIEYDTLCDLLNKKLKSMETDRKHEEEGSPEAQVVRSIRDNVELHIESITAKTIAQDVKWAEESEKKDFQRTIQRIGYILKELGLKTEHSGKGNRIDLNNDENLLRIDELKKRYLND
jgi:hypothetical protein